jgi:LPXTG-motif cell wall-anchored protein
MRKLTFAIAVAAAAASLIGTGVQAQVGPSSQQVQAGATFTVEYDCESFAPSPTVFVFQGVTVVAPCGSTESGTSSARFTAPGVAGTYVGTADPCGPLSLKVAGLRFTQSTRCPVPLPLETFTVVVVGAATTTTITTTTTIAPTTTVAPTTTAVGAVPPAPTTTVAAPAALPATGPNRTGTGVVIALVLLALGGGLVLASRRRGDTPAG